MIEKNIQKAINELMKLSDEKTLKELLKTQSGLAKVQMTLFNTCGYIDKAKSEVGSKFEG